jgi:DNA-binding CsgD family transcriptional regulator
VLHLGTGRCASRAGDTPTARRSFEQAWEAAREHDDRGQLVAAAVGMGETVVSAGTVDDALIRMLERTIATVGRRDSAAYARLTARLATELYWSPALYRSRRLATEAVAAARAIRDPRTLAATLAAQQFVLRGPDDLNHRIALGEELRSIAFSLDDDELELHARRILIPDRLQTDLSAADAELNALADLATRTRRPIARWYHRHYEASRAIMSGRTDAAWQLVSDSESLGRQIGAQPATLYAVAQRFQLLRATGRVGEAETEVRREAARWPHLAIFRAMLTLLLADLDRRDEAFALLDSLSAERCAALPADSLWLAGVATLAEAAAILNSRDHAAAIRPVLEPYSGRIAMQGVVGWYGAIDRYLALLATTLEDWAEAEKQFRAALQLHAAWTAPPFITATLAGHAAMLRRRGNPGDRERASRLHIRTGHHHPPTQPRADSLTQREQEILAQIAGGNSNKEIAHRLYLSVHTVQRHVANIYAKIGARNRAEATAYILNNRGKP